MVSISKILRIVFIVLIVLIIIELGIYGYFLLGNTSSNSNSIVKSLPKSVVTPIVSPQVINESSALDAKLLDIILTSSKEINKDVLKSYVITVQLEGEISTLKFYEENDPKNLFDITIQGNEGGTHKFILLKDSDKAVNDVHVADSQGNILHTTDLKVGDTVHVTLNMDITHSRLDDYKLLFTWNFTRI